MPILFIAWLLGQRPSLYMFARQIKGGQMPKRVENDCNVPLIGALSYDLVSEWLTTGSCIKLAST